MAWLVTLAVVSAVTLSGAREVAVSSDGSEVGRAGAGKVIQLVYRGNHGDLEVSQDGLEFLESLDSDPFDIVSVVGGYHSGKSFLLNQLLGLGPDEGFRVTADVDPTTHGLQMFTGRVPLAGSKPTFFVDTEGLAATENNNDYDAKIFAIVSIISTQLLYTSIGGINLRDLEYLELLAQRAQLFSLKSKLGGKAKATTGASGSAPAIASPSSKSSSQVVQSMVEQDQSLSFPALTWVVNSFHMNLGKETPKQWLERMLLESKHKQEDDSDVSRGSLSAIFSVGTDCQPLSMPVTKEVDWHNLGNLVLQEVTEEYRAGLMELRDKITERSLQRKQARWTGRELADLLRLLVDAANQGSIGKIPSLWEMMLRNQVQTAGEEAVGLHRKSLAQLRSMHPPLPTKAFTLAAQDSGKQAVLFFNEAVFGYRHALVASGKKAMEDKCAGMSQDEALLNDAAIEKLLQETVNTHVGHLEKKISTLDQAPKPTKALTATLTTLRADATAVLGKVQFTQYEEQQAQYASQLRRQTQQACDQKLFQNEKLARELQLSAAAGSMDLYQNRVTARLTTEARADVGVRCSTMGEVKAAAKDAREAAMRFFDQVLGAIKDEHTSVAARKAALRDLEVSLQDRELPLVSQCVYDMADQFAQQLADEVTKYYFSLAPEMSPMEERALHDLAKEREKQATKSYTDSTRDYRSHFDTAVKAGLSNLRDLLKEAYADLVKSNDNGWQRLVRKPLHKAFRDIRELMTPPDIFHIRPASPSNFLGFSTPFSQKCIARAKMEITEANVGTTLEAQVLDRVLWNWITQGEMGEYLLDLDRRNKTQRYIVLFFVVLLLGFLAKVLLLASSSRTGEKRSGGGSSSSGSSFSSQGSTKSSASPVPITLKVEIRSSSVPKQMQLKMYRSNTVRELEKFIHGKYPDLGTIELREKMSNKLIGGPGDTLKDIADRSTVVVHRVTVS